MSTATLAEPTIDHSAAIRAELEAEVRKLIERRQAEARLSADRREQKNTDEFASRAAWNRQHDSDRADVF